MSSDQFACQYTQGAFSQITLGQYFESVVGNHVSVDSGVSADVKYGLAVEGVYGGALSTNLTGSTQVGWGPKYSFNASDETEIAESNAVYYEKDYTLSVGATESQRMTYQNFKFSAKLAIGSQFAFWLGSAGYVQTAFGVSKKDGEVSTGDIDVNSMIGPSMTAAGVAAASLVTFILLIIKMRKWAADVTPTQTLYVKKGVGCYLGSMEPAVAAVPPPAPAAAGVQPAPAAPLGPAIPARLSELQVSSGTILAKCYEGVDRSLPSGDENISQGNGLPKSQLMMDGNQVQLTADDGGVVTLRQGAAEKGKIVLRDDGTAEFGSYNARDEAISLVTSGPDRVEATYSDMQLLISNNGILARNGITSSLLLTNDSIIAQVGTHVLSINDQTITVGSGGNQITIDGTGVAVTDNFKILNSNIAGVGPNVLAQLQKVRADAEFAKQKAQTDIQALEDKVTTLENNAKNITSQIEQKVQEKIHQLNKEELNAARFS